MMAHRVEPSVTGFVAGILVAVILTLMLPPKEKPIYVPCAIPVFAMPAQSAEELQARAALRHELLDRCRDLVSVARYP
jgi:hypothetical protein